MPASQLKRLKASLREQGVTGPQKSKKQKKQHSAGKTASDRVQRNAALQQIRDSFNPFELRATNARPEKFKSASAKDTATNGKGRYKEVLHRPGVSKSAGEEMRRATLLPEIQRRNKVGGLLDRRIGEGDVDMTPEERAVQRFAREKERKAKGKSLFDLEGSDEEGAGRFGATLTHGGRRIDDLAADDFGEEISGDSEDEEDDGELLRRKRRRPSEDEEDDAEGPEEPEEQEPERKKTKKEVMEEVIAKSKMHKYERQKVKEDDDDLRAELDQGMGELMGLLHGVKKPPKETEPAPAVDSNGPTVNPDRQKLLDGMDRDQADKEYDKYMKDLVLDKRAAPSDRTKTAEEKAKDEAERLRILEEKRMKRMRGEDVSDDERRDDATAGDRDLEGDEDIPDEAAEFGFTSSAPIVKGQKEDVQPDEDEFDLDDELVADNSDVDLSEDDSDGSSETGSAAEAEAPEDEEDEFVKDILGPETASGSNEVKVGEKGAVSSGSGLAFTYSCPGSHSELLELVQDLPAEQLVTVIQRIRALYHPSLSASNKESMADFSCALVDHIAYMGDNKQPMAVIEQIIRHLHSLSRTYPTQIGEQFRKNLAAFQERGQPSAGDLVILTAIGSIYPTSDHWHQVVTPAVTLMARWLGLNASSTAKPATSSVSTTGAFLVALCLKYQTLSKRYIPEALRFTLRVLATSSVDKSQSARHVANLMAMADLWKDKSAFLEIFTPALAVLKKHSAKKEQQTLSIQLQQSRLRRRPLELHHHRKLPIRTSVPKFEENFNPDKHYDPDKERSDAKKLQKEYKRERKGALRELRKDANFIAREQLKEKRTRDEEYEKKYRRLVASVQAEEGAESNAYAREKAKRQSKR